MRKRRLAAATACAVLLIGVGVALAPDGWTAGRAGKLQQARVKAAKKVYELQLARFGAGAVQAEEVYRWSARWRAAAGSEAATKAHLTRMKQLQARVKAQHKTGRATAVDLTAAEYYLLEARVWAAGGS